MGRSSLKVTRQEEIVIAFYELAKKQGLENASIAKTAEYIGIAPSLILHYFDTKEQLIHGLVDYILNKYLLIFKVASAIEKKPVKRLLAVFDNLFSNKWNSLCDDGVSYSCYALAIRDRALKAKYRKLLETLRNQLENLMEECNREGSLSIDNPAQMADLIFGLIDGTYYFNTLTEDKKQAKLYLEKYKAITLSLLRISDQS